MPSGQSVAPDASTILTDEIADALAVSDETPPVEDPERPALGSVPNGSVEEEV